MSSSADVAVPEPMSAIEQFREAMGSDSIAGLEDVRQEDLTIPVISIDHKKGVYVDKLTGAEYPEIDGVLLGKLTSRVMWPDQQASPGQKAAPMCKSRDSLEGTPTDLFPWSDWAKGKEKNPEWSPEALHSETLACATCYFAQWGSAKKNDSPRCTMQYVFPIIIGDSTNISGLLTVQRTGIKPANAYITGFVRDGLPLFTHRTTLTLDQNKTGDVDWAKPKFARGEPTAQDPVLWKQWADGFAEVKRQLTGRDLGDSLVTKKGDTTVNVGTPVADEATAPTEDAKEPW